ncbi:BamA/TamA family outer membrane protein [Segatella oris]|uniref:translocation and assembly module lipoprotein TamL n=1 Tax=Segatella oris TaxID=28135 RepID=UPI0028E422E9|nr:BamA/TamA family outer membrane protein [Segatella oris]
MKYKWIYILTVSLLLVSCNATKFVPEGSYLLDGVKVESADKELDASTLQDYVRQKGNSKWFSLFKIPMGTYALAGRDSTKWLNRMLRHIGEEPVVFDSLQAQLSMDDLTTAMHNMGYMHGRTEMKVTRKGRKVKVVYRLLPGEPYRIAIVHYDIQDSLIKKLIATYRGRNAFKPSLKTGSKFTVDALNAERTKLTSFLLNHGYYKFHKDFIQYSADSARNSRDINVTLQLLPYRTTNLSSDTLHPCYTIDSIRYLSGDDDERLHLRKSVLRNATMLDAHTPYSADGLQQTYNKFARLQAVRYTNISFREHPDTTLLDCDIQISTNKPNTISFQPEGTNTAGDFGAAASLTWENRNLFRGSELLSVQLRGAYEAITGLEGYQNQNYVEYGLESKLQFPRFLAPFLSSTFKHRSLATSELSLSYNLQNRPEFHRRVFSSAWRYRWSESHHHISYRVDMLDLNYIYMPWISSTFKRDYLDDVSNRNAILRYNYEDLFIMKIGAGLSYSDGENVVRANIETAGNILRGFSNAFRFKQNKNGQYTLFNIAYAQYVKFDIDYTHLFHFDSRNSLAAHVDLGIAWPYGNSTVLPFEKRYFSGGANSVRGWTVRGLGPGKYRGSDGRIDFINQTGDVKLNLNLEYRSYLFWKLNGAAFIDAGNIWTLRNYAEQPGGQFNIVTFYKQIAVAYGLGLRLNFDYFILRFDVGMKAINPGYKTRNEHYAIFHPDFGRDIAFHFAVGLPF